MADDRPLEEQIRLEFRDSVAWITIDRPQVGNAISPPCRDRLLKIFEDLNDHQKARAVVLTATGDKLFCPGAELGYSYDLGRPESVPDPIVGDSRRRMLNGYYKLLPAIMDCDAPVIAAVNGTAAGMGAHLAFACDLVIAAEESKFIEVFARRGLVPDALGTYLLPRLVGPQKAKELMFFADDIPAAEAHRLGLVNKLVPRADLASAAEEWAGRLAAGPSRSFALTKWLVNQSFDSDRHTAMQNEAWAVEINGYTEDAQEGIASFMERRDPTWRGF